MGKKHPRDPDDWDIVRDRRNMTHAENCATGYFGVGQYFHQVHHILPVTCLGDGSIEEAVGEDQLTIIRNCLKMTDWNINDEPNCIGLPLKAAYHDASAPPGWNGLPCHQVDHAAYIEEVAAHLKRKVWEPIAIEAEDCKDFGTSIAGALNAASSHWRGQLKGRGWRPIGPAGGTEHCWAHRADAGMEDLWYLPFSMAADPSRRSPPADFKKLSANMKEYMSKIFQILKP